VPIPPGLDGKAVHRAPAYAFNDRSLRRLHETIKDAVDPNGILSAGRYGIWPKHLRKA
jgi:hypothetical protein